MLDKPVAAFQPHGVYAASVTPLNADPSSDLGALTTHSRWLLENGCDGLGALGTTAEANSIGFQDRLKIITHLSRAVAPERLMPGVSSCALADALTPTKACLDQGVTSVLCSLDQALKAAQFKQPVFVRSAGVGSTRLSPMTQRISETAMFRRVT